MLHVVAIYDEADGGKIFAARIAGLIEQVFCFCDVERQSVVLLTAQREEGRRRLHDAFKIALGQFRTVDRDRQSLANSAVGKWSLRGVDLVKIQSTMRCPPKVVVWREQF